MINHKKSDERLDATFSALADPTQRAILSRLASGEASVLELAKPFRISLPTVSRPLKVLQRAGLITRSPRSSGDPAGFAAGPLEDVWIGWNTTAGSGIRACDKEGFR